MRQSCPSVHNWRESRYADRRDRRPGLVETLIFAGKNRNGNVSSTELATHKNLGAIGDIRVGPHCGILGYVDPPSFGPGFFDFFGCSFRRSFRPSSRVIGCWPHGGDWGGGGGGVQSSRVLGSIARRLRHRGVAISPSGLAPATPPCSRPDPARAKRGRSGTAAPATTDPPVTCRWLSGPVRKVFKSP